MKKNLLTRFRSIRTSIIVVFSVLIVFSLLTYLVISLRYTENTVLKNSKAYTSQLIGQVNNDIDSYINYMENISYIVSSNYDVRDYLFTENLSDERARQLRERITTVFKTVSDTRGDITNIALLPQDRDPIINDGERGAESLYEGGRHVLVSGGVGAEWTGGYLILACAERGAG